MVGHLCVTCCTVFAPVRFMRSFDVRTREALNQKHHRVSSDRWPRSINKSVRSVIIDQTEVTVQPESSKRLTHNIDQITADVVSLCVNVISLRGLGVAQFVIVNK